MRCKLFVPGSRPELFAKAMAGEADALSFDLEDAVDESRKDEARKHVADFLRSLPSDRTKTIIVRVNGIDTPHFEKDVAAIRGPGLDLVNLPMVESAEQVRRAAAVTKDIGLMANIETAKGLRLAAEIAGAHPTVKGLQLGFGDLLEPLGIDRYNPTVILQFQLAVRLAAGESRVFAYDSAMANVKDLAFLRQEAEMARKLGFLGKSAIHPSQVAVINEVFRPSEAEIAHSLRVVESAKENVAKGVGAWMVDGKMIDAPFVVRAENILNLARRLKLL
ncbi:CoA ester lyase [Betaproteobacteria bacterium GR16-43]|nr:CoA ester lyase [Betaproteobacteria bacterium GR16-43]